MGIVYSRSIFSPEFKAIFRFSTSACYLLQSQRLVPAARYKA
jgi:hypothetical protein